MRILMYCPIFPPAIGGPATQAFNLCKALVMNGEVPIVVTYGEKFSLDESEGFKIYTFRINYTYTPIDKALRWLIFPFYIVYKLRSEKIDILHSHSVSALSFVAAMCAKLMSIPRIIKFAGDWVWETLSTYKLQAKDPQEMYTKNLLARIMTVVERIGLNLFNKIWVISEFRRGNIKFLLGTDEKVIVINNCLLLEGGGVRTWTEGEEVVIVSANRFIPHKRLPLMVQFFSEMNIPNSKLVLIGGGAENEVETVREAAKKFNVEEKVELKGILSIEEVHNEFKKASFYLSTSIEEGGTPNVYIEAMNYGLPVIATDLASTELVIDQKTGLMFVPEDHERVVQAMKKLSLDIPLRTKMSEASYERSKLFNLEHRIGEFLGLYKSLLNK